VEALVAIKREYLVTRPFVAVDRLGNAITIGSKEVTAYPPVDHWIRGEAERIRFGVLESVFVESTIPKHSDAITQGLPVDDVAGPIGDIVGPNRLHVTPPPCSNSSPSAANGHSTLARHTIRCPKCESEDTRPSLRKIRHGSMIKALWLKPYRCQTCDEKFFRFRWKD
jgi:hypothetical protein